MAHLDPTRRGRLDKVDNYPFVEFEEQRRLGAIGLPDFCLLGCNHKGPTLAERPAINPGQRPFRIPHLYPALQLDHHFDRGLGADQLELLALLRWGVEKDGNRRIDRTIVERTGSAGKAGEPENADKPP